MLVTLAGMVIVVSPEQHSKALLAIDVILQLMLTVFSLSFLLKRFPENFL